MLFRKDIDRQCAYCSRCAKIDETYMVCKKRGVVEATFSCRRFQYDPLRRIPEAKAKFTPPSFDSEAFTL